MQKVINVLALLSFLGTSAIIGGGGYLYLNRGVFIKNFESKLASFIGEKVLNSLPTALDAELPQALPNTTGGVVPF
mgnify:CR=1 FL=1|tara:strand:+ start:474 stop:701 length:228 start_codon:yes stop_codon:yes gene_type:complete